MDFGYTYAPNLIHQGASVITEISSANGYRNPTSSNNYESTHGPKLPKKHFQKVQNYTTSYKIKMRYDYIGCTHTCTIKKCRKSARCVTVDAKSRVHLRKTHLLCWSTSHPLLVHLPSQFDTQILAESDWGASQRPKGPLVHTKSWLNNTSKVCYKRRPWVHCIFKEFICIVMLPIFSWRILFPC